MFADSNPGFNILRVCKKCGVDVLSASEPERIKNCLACRAAKRTARKSSASSSSASLAKGSQPVNGKKTKKNAKELKKLEGKAGLAAAKMALQSSGEVCKTKCGVRVFKSPWEMYEELRSEGMDAHDKRYHLEFHGCFESVGQVGMVGNKEQVEKVAAQLVAIDLLLDEFVSEGRPYSKVDGSSHSTVYSCSCQPRGVCCGQIKVTAETAKVYDNGVVCQKTTVRVYHN